MSLRVGRKQKHGYKVCSRNALFFVIRHSIDLVKHRYAANRLNIFFSISVSEETTRFGNFQDERSSGTVIFTEPLAGMAPQTEENEVKGVVLLFRKPISN